MFEIFKIIHHYWELIFLLYVKEIEKNAKYIVIYKNLLPGVKLQGLRELRVVLVFICKQISEKGVNRHEFSLCVSSVEMTSQKILCELCCFCSEGLQNGK